MNTFTVYAVDQGNNESAVTTVTVTADINDDIDPIVNGVVTTATTTDSVYTVT